LGPPPVRQRRHAGCDELERARRDRALFERYRDPADPVDRDVLVERFLPLARQLAARCPRATEPLDDLFQVACLGLVKAIDRFDVDRETAFSSYAVPTIMGELKRYFRDKTWPVRVPRDLKELALRVERAAERLTRDELGRPPSVSELAEAVQASHEEVLEALEAITSYHSVSLDARRHNDEDDEATLADSLGQADNGYGQAEQRVLLDGLLRHLNPREREVVRLRFEEDLTQQEIGDRIGISQMQVSRILRASIPRLHEIAAQSAH
jgi:RNA polymerase sigma-B factor